MASAMPPRNEPDRLTPLERPFRHCASRPGRLRRADVAMFVPQMFRKSLMRPPGLSGQALGVARLHR